MPISDRRRSRRRAYEDIEALRDRLPRYWWAEVSRVRAVIDTDADAGREEAELFELVAAALAKSSSDDSRAHAHALYAASCRLSAIADAQASALV